MSLLDTGMEMAVQDNRSTQYPLFVIQQDTRIWADQGNDYDERERKEDTEEYWLCDACQKLYEAGDDMIDDCHDCDEEAYDHYKIEQEFVIGTAGVFFTAKACQQHIDENNYHYRNPQVYSIAAWRNPEMVEVMQSLIIGAGHELPSHYR